LVTSGEVSEEKRDQPSFLTSLVSNVIEDWNVYNDCKDREDSEKPSKPSTVETWVNEGLNAYANYAKNVNGRKKGPSFIEGNLYEKQSAKPSTVETWVNEVRLTILKNQNSATNLSDLGFECLCKICKKCW